MIDLTKKYTYNNGCEVVGLHLADSTAKTRYPLLVVVKLNDGTLMSDNLTADGKAWHKDSQPVLVEVKPTVDVELWAVVWDNGQTLTYSKEETANRACKDHNGNKVVHFKQKVELD